MVSAEKEVTCTEKSPTAYRHNLPPIIAHGPSALSPPCTISVNSVSFGEQALGIMPCN